MAKRIQRKRTKGWKMPEGAVYVGRPTRWGNPFKFSAASCDCGTTNGLCWNVAYRCHSAEAAVTFFRKDLQGLKKVAIRAELRGKDLACWCPLCEKHKDGKPLNEACNDCAPCHVDVLLEIANS